MDLATLVRSPKTPLPRSELLRGLGAAWREAETSLNAETAAHPRRGAKLVARFLAVAARCGEAEARGRAARLAGSVATREGRWSDAARHYRDAVRHLGAPETSAAREGAELGLAGVRLKQGRTTDAVKLAARVRRSAETRGDARAAAFALLQEAVAHHEGGAPARAVPLYERVIESLRAQQDVVRAAHAERNLANALVLLDRFDDAAPRYEHAAAGFDAAGSPADAATCRYNRGALLVQTDRLADAERALVDAEIVFRRLGLAADAAVVLVERGETFARARLLAEARRALRSALRSGGARMSADERSRATLRLARVESALGDTAAARRIAARRLPVETAETAAERAEILGRALAADGKTVDARKALERAARKFGAERPAGRARCLAAAAFCAAETDGDAARAVRLADEAERAANAVGTPGLRWAAAAAAFVAWRAAPIAKPSAGRTDAASAALARALEALESVREGLGGDAMRAALLRGGERWFASALRHVLDADGGDAALDLAERWRARALVDLLADRHGADRGGADRCGADRGGADRAARSGTDVRTTKLDALRRRLALLERRLAGDAVPPFMRSADAPSARRLRREIASAERALRDERARSPEPAAPRAGGFSASALRESIPEGTVVVAYHADASASATGSLAFVMDRTGLLGVERAGRPDEIASLVEELGFRLGKYALGPEYVARHGRRLAGETDRALSLLADRTLAPIARHISGARRLVIVPHGPWHLVPFAALPFGRGRLIESMTLACAPALAALAPRLAAATGTPIVVAAPDERAPQIAAEGRAVAAALGAHGRAAHLLEGDAATSQALRAAVAVIAATTATTAAAGPAPSCVHVAAHGRFRADAPELSGVRLADGWFRAFEWQTLPLDGSLVVLSGCETGVSRVGAGDEIEGLVRGVLASGAAEAIVSLWRVGDAETARFMSAFHAARGAHPATSAADSLRTVQRDLAAAGAPPFEWAGFVPWSRRM